MRVPLVQMTERAVTSTEYTPGLAEVGVALLVLGVIVTIAWLVARKVRAGSEVAEVS